MKLLSIIAFVFFVFFGIAQEFEGEIVYEQEITVYDSSLFEILHNELTPKSIVSYFRKGDKLTIQSNNGVRNYSLIKANDTLLYTWTDSLSPIQTVSFGGKPFFPNINSKKETILSYTCDSVSMSPFMDGSYSFTLAQNKENESYRKITANEQITFIDLYRVVCLEYTIEIIGSYFLTQRATEIRETPQDAHLFELPPNREIVPVIMPTELQITSDEK